MKVLRSTPCHVLLRSRQNRFDRRDPDGLPRCPTEVLGFERPLENGLTGSARKGRQPSGSAQTIVNRVTEYEIHEGKLELTVEGADKLWALKSHLTVPLDDITGVRPVADAQAEISGGVKLAGSRIPGVIQAGSFVYSDGAMFWDVRRPGHAIVITLQHEHYQALVVDVEDPEAAVQEISQALATFRR